MSIILFIVVLVLLILVHELGHFIVAKRSGIRVDEFGIFFPPKLWGRRIGETEYTLNLWPIGGFVRIFGESREEVETSGQNAKFARAFFNKPWYTQSLVLMAGVAFNVLAAWILFSIAFVYGIPTAVSEDELRAVRNPELTIVSVLPDSPAGSSGLRSGDTIVGLRTEAAELADLTPERAAAFIEANADSEFALTYRRGSEEFETQLVTMSGIVPDEPERAVLGISMEFVGERSVSVLAAPWEGLKLTLSMLATVVIAIGSFFASAFMLNADLSQVAGPVGIVSLVGDAAELGIVPLMTFTALISLNLAVINLLPIPALDGGRLLFVVIEAIKGSPIKVSVARTLNTLGFAFLIFLMLAVTYNDILRLVGFS